jgi:predicted signal transduction protein with EAL and GGDEF domain
MQVVAEGIEQPRQLAELREMGCGYGQGYLLARPMAASGVEALIRTGIGEPGRSAGPAAQGGPVAPDVNGSAKPGVPAA